MKKTNPGISFRDKRGDIIDLISQEKINAVTLITFKKGAVRANHYHNKTTQWNYVLSGKIKFLTQMPKGRVVKTIAKKGDFVVTVPKERHSLAGMADSVILVLTKGPRGGKEYETDTFRLEEPLTEKR